MERIERIQAALKPGVRFEMTHHDEWSAGLLTGHNDYPHWVRFYGETPGDAVDHLIEFLQGKRRDHARDARPPDAFLLTPFTPEGGSDGTATL